MKSIVPLSWVTIYKSSFRCKIIFYICYYINIIKNKYILRYQHVTHYKCQKEKQSNRRV